MIGALGDIYRAESTSQGSGDDVPDVRDAAVAMAEIAKPRQESVKVLMQLRASAAERVAIEKRAVDLTTAYLIRQGFNVLDVGATESYDLDATRGDEQIFVEVKGQRPVEAASFLRAMRSSSTQRSIHRRCFRW